MKKPLINLSLVWFTSSFFQRNAYIVVILKTKKVLVTYIFVSLLGLWTLNLNIVFLAFSYR